MSLTLTNPLQRQVTFRTDGPVVLTALALVGCLACVLVALVSVQMPKLLILPIGALAAAMIILSPKARLTLVVVGGMAVLQSSDSLDLSKLAYLAGAFLAIGVAYVRSASAESEALEKLRPLCRASMATIALILATSIVAKANGAEWVDWLRDAAPYLLASAIPFLALDSSQEKDSQRMATVLLVALGILAAASYFVEWAGNRRGLIELPFERLLLPTSSPVGGLFLYATARTFFSERIHVGWLALTVLLPASVMLTATRSTVLMLLGPLLMMALRKDVISRASSRFVVLIGVGTLVGFAFLPSVSTSLDIEGLVTRFSSVERLLQDPGSDRSYGEREAQTVAAWNQFLANPLVGKGPGVPIEWQTPYRMVENSFNVDTGVSFLSKFGLVGLGIAFVWFLSFKDSWRRIIPDLGTSPIRYAFLAYLVQITAGVLLRNPIEDKGVAFTLLLMLVLVVTTRDQAAAADEATENARKGGARA